MEDRIKAALQNVKYPGFDRDIVDLRMLDETKVEGSTVTLRMKPLHASDEVKQTLVKNIEEALETISLKAVVEFAGEQEKAEPELPPKKEIPGVKRIIPVASGKGGVGKSTVAVNIAIALSKEDQKVGLLDLDIYGPSIPTMFGLEGKSMIPTKGGKIMPVEKYGIMVVSIGFLLRKGEALIWRGPLADQIVRQFSYDCVWGDLDYLVMDLPPGTGDVQITLVQTLPIFGAIVVTTPQDVALADVGRAVDMFNQTDAPVLGIVENMSIFLCPHCGKESHVFGQGGGKRQSEERGIPLLGQIPLEEKITESGDSGEPVALSDGVVSDIFRDIARKIINSG